MPEVRFEASVDEVAVLDGYCSATGKDRTKIMKELLRTMTGRASRSKGARGQSEFKALLLDRDWTVDSITAGIAACDLIAADPGGTQYSVEVKNCSGILPAHKRQAMEQAKARRLPWLLANKLPGTSSWLVQRQDGPPAVWHKKGAE